MGRKNNERERGEWNKKSNLPYILLELREFECQSFHQLLTWKEKITTHFMHNQLGKKPFNDSTNVLKTSSNFLLLQRTAVYTHVVNQYIHMVNQAT